MLEAGQESGGETAILVLAPLRRLTRVVHRASAPPSRFPPQFPARTHPRIADADQVPYAVRTRRVSASSLRPLLLRGSRRRVCVATDQPCPFIPRIAPVSDGSVGHLSKAAGQVTRCTRPTPIVRAEQRSASLSSREAREEGRMKRLSLQWRIELHRLRDRAILADRGSSVCTA